MRHYWKRWVTFHPNFERALDWLVTGMFAMWTIEYGSEAVYYVVHGDLFRAVLGTIFAALMMLFFSGRVLLRYSDHYDPTLPSSYQGPAKFRGRVLFALLFGVLWGLLLWLPMPTTPHVVFGQWYVVLDVTTSRVVLGLLTFQAVLYVVNQFVRYYEQTREVEA